MMLSSKDPAHARNALAERISRSASETGSKKMMMDSLLNTMMDKMTSNVSMKKAELEALDPSGIISRGYSIVKDINGKIISSTDDVAAGDDIRITMRDGSISANVTEKGELPNG